MPATRVAVGDSRFAGRLRATVEGEVLFDAFSRGRYSTDASIYQVEPVGVLVPKTQADVDAAMALCREEGVSLLPRGGGSSQCGQTVGRSLVLDCSTHLNRMTAFDPGSRRARVQPGMVLDHLNAQLKQHGLWFPVDVSTGSRATIGGMTANNSCGSRSIRYGNMVHNVRAVNARLADGTTAEFGPVDSMQSGGNQPHAAMVAQTIDLAGRLEDELSARFPKVQRRVGGYNLDMVPVRDGAGYRRSRALDGIGDGTAWGHKVGDNLAHLLVGSEGTLGFFNEIEIDLAPLPRVKTLGICHFDSFYRSMDAAQHLVALDPVAVELVDHTLLGLAREIPIYAEVIDRHVRGDPEALLLVEFAEPEQDENLRRLERLDQLMGDLGYPGGVVKLVDPAQQKEVWEVRKACLNIAMSMKGDGKPVSFIEDCAVRLEDLAEYTRRLTEVMHKHGSSGTWYAHASVGTLHVRPILNLKQDTGVKALRAIAEEAFEMVREYKGAHSGEHGDGIVRSEFHRPMYGDAIADGFEAVKDLFDPAGLMNPGKIVRPFHMDDRTLFRFKPDYAPLPFDPALDWSAWGGFPGAVEMCNNNGACRKTDAGVMCPSYRVTRDERDLTRGRANSLRLAMSGQLGPEALTSDAMLETLKLCVSCKGCRRECPTGVDMARMKIEVLAQRRKRRGLGLRDRLVAYLPHYAPVASMVGWLLNLRDRVPGLAALSERVAGLSAQRSLPVWHSRPFVEAADLASVEPPTAPAAPEVVLLADTFNRYFEPDNLRAAVRVLTAGGYRLTAAAPAAGGRPLCCGRTFLAAGMVEEARAEMRRTVETLLPAIERGAVLVGLEPSCILTFRDELLAVLPGPEADRVSAATMLIEEFLDRECKAGRLRLPLAPIPAKRALLHGHCHQKAFGALSAVGRVADLVPDLDVATIDGSCCGMAGAFGYQAETYRESMAMAELGLLPEVRGVDDDTIILADGTSCRHQIADGAGREAMHVVRLLDEALVDTEERGAGA